jgi:hypothetical protein
MSYIVYRNVDDVSHFEICDNIECALITQKLCVANEKINDMQFQRVINDDAYYAKHIRMTRLKIVTIENVARVEIVLHDETIIYESLSSLLRTTIAITYD